MLARRLRLDVYDRDRNKAEGDSLGFAYVNLDLIAEGQVTEQWVQLRGSFTGELRIRMLVLSGTDDSVQVRARRFPMRQLWGSVLMCVLWHVQPAPAGLQAATWC